MEELKEEDVTIVYYDFYDHIKGDYIRQRCIESWKRCMPKAKIICKTENTPEIKEFMESNRWCQECKKKSMYNDFVDTIRRKFFIFRYRCIYDKKHYATS